MMKKHKYTAKQIEFLRTEYLSMSLPGLTLAFNKRFRLHKTDTSIKSTLKRCRIFCGRKLKDRLYPQYLKYTKKQAQFLYDNYPGRTVGELTAIFNNRFRLNKKVGQIRAFKKNHGITSGLNTRFQKGNKPWNNGSKGKGLTGANTGSFKKGHAPANQKPLGSERISPKDGFVSIKIAEKDPFTGSATRYIHKHVHVYKQDHGPVPEGMVVAFRDGDRLNIEPENLMLISRAELLRLNKYGYKDTPAELKPSVLAIAKLEVKTFTLTNNP